MNKLPIEKRVAIISALVEGNSIRSTSRMTGASTNTITKLLVDVAKACETYQDNVMRNLQCRKLQIDEIWSFVYAKEKNVPDEMQGQFGVGSVWTFAAIDAETKLVPSWMVGNRDGCNAKSFVDDLAGRLAHRVQVSTDGHKMYLEAMESGFGGEVDYAMVVKHFGNPGSNDNPETRYSPGDCCGVEKTIITGNPRERDISTSYIERQNLTMRMRMRRFTRLTNGFSKKLENHCHAIALHFMHYNFVRRHLTLRVTPAMKAGVTDHLARYWVETDLQTVLDYQSAASFRKVIMRAMQACLTVGIPLDGNFTMVDGQYKLTRFACYLIAMNGDNKKPQVAAAQLYFAALAETFQSHIEHADNIERVLVRQELTDGNKSLCSTAKSHGVVNYAFFLDAGYRGLYNMSLAKLLTIKNVEQSKFMDRMSKTELAANLFRITQTDEKIKTDNIRGQQRLQSVAEEVGRKVRSVMVTPPEHLPLAEPIGDVKKKIKQTSKKFKQIDVAK